MFRLILVLLLTNASYRSYGNPINQNTAVSVASSMTALAGHCENSFLSNQIKSQIIHCSDQLSTHGEKQFQCLIFYDINRQLCAAVGAAKLSLTQDYLAEINEEQDVNSLCLTAKDWVFSNLTEFSRYKLAVDKIFKHPVTCGKICGVEDLMSDDANFFCKYFKWGMDILKNQVGATSNQDSSAVNAPLLTETTNVETPAGLAPGSNDLQDVQIKNITLSNDPKFTMPNSPPVKSVADQSEAARLETSSAALAQNSQPSEPSSSSKAEVTAKVEDTVAMPDNMPIDKDVSKPVGVDKSSESVPKADTVQSGAVKTDTVDEPKSEDAQKKDKEFQSLNSELEHRAVVIDNPEAKLPGDVGDYQDSEDKDGLSDIQGGDDGEDPMIGDLDSAPDEQKPVKKTKTIDSTFTGEREYYPNPIQDGFPDDDDHFFPFFLTAVILVVLLYVIYHNKHKVSKMFFGLIVEGRQGGRRRNSRGHAYRRLDTLEQAMSANTAAPPSKIIY